MGGFCVDRGTDYLIELGVISVLLRTYVHIDKQKHQDSSVAHEVVLKKKIVQT